MTFFTFKAKVKLTETTGILSSDIRELIIKLRSKKYLKVKSSKLDSDVKCDMK